MEGAAQETQPALIWEGSVATGCVLIVAGLALLPVARAVVDRIAPRRTPIVPRWGAGHAVGAFLVGVAALLAASQVLPGDGLFDGLYRAMLSLAAVSLAACVFVWRLHPDGLAALGMDSGGNLRSMLAGATGYALLFPGVFGLTVLWPHLGPLVGIEVRTQAVLDSILALEGVDLGRAFVIAVLVQPLLEETVFRGFLQPLLVRSLGGVGGVAVTSLIFARLHGVEALLPLFALSLVLGWLQLRTQRITAAWVVHGQHNACTLALAIAVTDR